MGQPDDRSPGAWPILGILGCLTVSVGLCNIVAIFFRQYLGHKLTAICLLGGGTMVGISVHMIENSQLCDENISFFYFVSLIMMLLPAIFYFLFRDGVEIWVKRKKRISKSNFRKLTTGKKNYWWYESLHKEAKIGFLYYLNKAFTILFVSTFALTLFLGFKKEMSLILCPMNVLLYTLSAIMTAFSRIQDNLDFHGTPFVIFAKSNNGGIDSLVFDFFMVIFNFMPAYAVLLMTAEIWGIPLPTL